MSKDKKKEKKHSFIRVLKNLWFMLKYSFKYAPSYTLVTLGEAFGRSAWHIIGVLFTKLLWLSIWLLTQKVVQVTCHQNQMAYISFRTEFL